MGRRWFLELAGHASLDGPVAEDYAPGRPFRRHHAARPTHEELDGQRLPSYQEPITLLQMRLPSSSGS